MGFGQLYYYTQYIITHSFYAGEEQAAISYKGERIW